MNVPFMLIKPKKHDFRFLPFLSEKISFAFPGIKYDIENARVGMSTQAYVSASLLNSMIMGLIFSVIITLKFLKEKPMLQAILSGVGLGFCILILWMMLLLFYPRIIAGKKAEDIDNNLIFALKDLHLQVGAGVNLYHAILNVSISGYGPVSEEFKQIIQRVETGTPLDKSLEEMARETKSKFLQKTVWQLVNSLRAGASLKETLESLITDLKSEQYAKIKEYGQELNMMILMYLLFAIAIPSIGATLLIVLSGFGTGGGVKEVTFIMFGLISMIIQVVLITFIKSRRPAITF